MFLEYRGGTGTNPLSLAVREDEGLRGFFGELSGGVTSDTVKLQVGFLKLAEINYFV